MSKATNDNAMNKLNRIKPATNALFNVLFLILGLGCVIPHEFSGSAYKFLWEEKDTILKALLISVEVTVIGTVVGVALTTLMGYVLSRPGYKLNGFLTIVVFIPMIFGGGMVANYVVVGQVLHMSNTLWALILPLCVSSFNVTISRTFFRSIIESAKIDGATQMTVFAKIVLPISKPVLATIGLFLAFGYWNDWFQSSLFITDNNLLSLQALLNSMQKNIEYIAQHPDPGISLADYKRAMPSEGIRMAIAVVVAVPIACIYPFFQKYFISGLTVGAVKG